MISNKLVNRQQKRKNLVYFDDQTKQLEHFEKNIKLKDFDVITVNAFSNVYDLAFDGEITIFLCDLRLTNLTSNERGIEILKSVRKIDSSIFLGLYTAFNRDLEEQELNELDELNIRIYRKGDVKAFQEQLKRDYDKFDKTSNGNLNRKLNVTAMDVLKDKVLAHLKGISNQNVIIPITGYPDITAKELRRAIQIDDEVGEKYIIEWLHTTELIINIRKGGK